MARNPWYDWVMPYGGNMNGTQCLSKRPTDIWLYETYFRYIPWVKPNWLTVARFFVAASFVLSFVFTEFAFALVLIVTIEGLLDYLDGPLARSLGSLTVIGWFGDQLVDKIGYVTMAATLNYLYPATVVDLLLGDVSIFWTMVQCSYGIALASAAYRIPNFWKERRNWFKERGPSAEEARAKGFDAGRSKVWFERFGIAFYAIAFAGEHAHTDKPAFYGAVLWSAAILMLMIPPLTKRDDTKRRPWRCPIWWGILVAVVGLLFISTQQYARPVMLGLGQAGLIGAFILAVISLHDKRRKRAKDFRS